VTSRRTSFQVLASAVQIQYADARLESAFRYLAERARQPFDIRRTLSYEIRGSGPYEIYEEGDLHGEAANAVDVVHVVYGRVYRRVLERYTLTGWVAFHGAVASVGGRRTLILGHKGTGKTTLATRLLFSGHRVEGDEMVLVRSGQVLPLPRAFHLKPGIVRHVPELGGLLPDLPKAYTGDIEISALDPSQAGFDWAISVGPIDRVGWITPNHGKETRLEVRSSFETLRHVLECSLGWGERRDVLVATAAELVAPGGFELFLGDAAEAVALLQAR